VSRVKGPWGLPFPVINALLPRRNCPYENRFTEPRTFWLNLVRYHLNFVGMLPVQGLQRRRLSISSTGPKRYKAWVFLQSYLNKTPFLGNYLITMGYTYVYDASLQVDSDWGELLITTGGAVISFPNATPTNTALDGSTTLKWGKRQSYNFDSVAIS
jgi:hypothetical protein